MTPHDLSAATAYQRFRITINKEKLHHAIGGDVDIHNRLECYTARALTDSEGNNYKPDERFRNAHSWMTHAHEDGRLLGVQQERERWQRKIREVFGL